MNDPEARTKHYIEETSGHLERATSRLPSADDESMTAARMMCQLEVARYAIDAANSSIARARAWCLEWERADKQEGGERCKG